MKQHKSIIWSLVLMVAVATLYRVIPGRPHNFAPQWALAIFGGAVISNKRLALVLPVLSMFLSDLLYFGLYNAGISSTNGFYEGQWINYLLFASVTVFGFFIKRITTGRVFAMSVLGATWFFIVSNFLTWAGAGEYVEYPHTWQGLVACYTAGLPFYGNSVVATLLFGAVLFGAWHLVTRRSVQQVPA